MLLKEITLGNQVATERMILKLMSEDVVMRM